MTDKKFYLIGAFILVGFLMLNIASAADVKYCCEKTTYGAWCQDAPKEQCNPSFKNTPTSCEAVSYCKQGCCYDSSEGSCMENTPQRVCQDSGGVWSESKTCDIPQCSLGCCVLGTQASFITLVRCKKLSAFYGLITDFRTNINDELSCIAIAGASDEGACVYELDYTTSCKFTTRQGCNSIKEGTKTGNGTVTSSVEFYKDFLCSAEDLGNICGLTEQTTCADGKDEVYFVDSCGNIANIYDASRITDKTYWRKIVSKASSCQKTDKNCGNCNYFEGSVCKNAKKTSTSPTYGEYACSNLNCKSTSLGKPMKHGETWCETDKYPNSVGSRYYRHICMDGEEIVEPCADYRQEICIEDKIESQGVEFSQAGCRVNRWQDCVVQIEKTNCENSAKRDCMWAPRPGDIDSKESDGNQIVKNGTVMACIPRFPPGLKFWDGSATRACSHANYQCIVTYEKGLFSKKKCLENCECLEQGWTNQQIGKCTSLGDCGPKINFLNIKGNDNSYSYSSKKYDSDDEGGGWFG